MIPLDTVSLFWFGSLLNLHRVYEKMSLEEFKDRLTSLTNMYYLVGDYYILFME